MSLLEIRHKWIHVDILKGETKARSFLEMNPAGQIPVLVLPDGNCLSESNAILNYLADGSRYLPGDRFVRAKILQWQFFEQYSHEPYIAVARFISKYLGRPPEREDEFQSKQQGGYKALSVMEQQLSNNDYITGPQCSIADISLYAYTHVANEGGVSLQNYPSITAWLRRIENQPGYISMAEAHA